MRKASSKILTCAYCGVLRCDNRAVPGRRAAAQTRGAAPDSSLRLRRNEPIDNSRMTPARPVPV